MFINCLNQSNVDNAYEIKNSTAKYNEQNNVYSYMTMFKSNVQYCDLIKINSCKQDGNLDTPSDLVKPQLDNFKNTMNYQFLNLNPNAVPFRPILRKPIMINDNLDPCATVCRPRLGNKTYTTVKQTHTLNPNANIFKSKFCVNIVNDTGDLHNSEVTSNMNDDIPNQDNVDNIYSVLNTLRVKNTHKIIIAQLNINSLRYKYDALADIITNNIDILCINETKLDDSFPSNNFKMNGFSLPYRLDRNINGGGTIVYVREDIPSKELKSIAKPNNLECIFIEINIHNKKWIIANFYNPNKNLIANQLSLLANCLNHYYSLYDNIIILGDFNAEVTNLAMNNFCEVYNLKGLVKEPTCFKSTNNPSCIDIILTNRINNFQNTTTVETGLSDFHKMVVTVLKTSFKKRRPRVVLYRDYKTFSKTLFLQDLNSRLATYNIRNMDFDIFENIFMEKLNAHAPIKQKFLRANDSPFMTKILRKAIMHRSKLKNDYNKHMTESHHLAYKKQRNLCTGLLRKAKSTFYKNLKPNSINDNKLFWRNVKPLFSDKQITTENITLVDNERIINEESEISEIFSDFFSNVVKKLCVNIDNDLLSSTNHIIDPILKATVKYKLHPSVLKIKENYNTSINFSFSHVSLKMMNLEISKINTNKSNPIHSIPGKIVKDNYEFFANFLYDNFNNMITICRFPDNLKLADITPGYKNGGRLDKNNYRPVSILSTISKIYEKLLYYQMEMFFDPILSKMQCGFRKGFSTQHCLIVMLEKWKKSIDLKGSAGALLTDLSKAFDCIEHDLLIAKLHAYGLDINALSLLQSYLSNRYQRVRVNSYFSSWKDLTCGVPQGSILGPLLFNIYICDLFIFLEGSNIASYADDNTPYTTANTNESVIHNLESDSVLLFTWLSSNALKANPDKSHLLLNSTDYNLFAMIDSHKITNSEHVKLLGITIDNGLSFNQHVTKLCKKATQKLHALSRVCGHMDIKQRRTIMKSFILSQFGYCPLVWLFHSRQLNTRINNIHERALRLVYNDPTSSFDELLEKDKSCTVHERNIQTLAIEVFKVIHKISPVIMNDVFVLKNKHIYNSKHMFQGRNIRTVNNGLDTLSMLGPKIWDIIPKEIKNIHNLYEFKKQIRMWKPVKCPCRLCKTYVAGVGFVNVE